MVSYITSFFSSFNKTAAIPPKPEQHLDDAGRAGQNSRVQAAVHRASAAAMVDEQPLGNDRRTVKSWTRLGLPIVILNQYPDCAKFLLDSKLIYAIVGFQNSCEDASLHGLRLDGDGHPLIKVQGEWIRWDQLKNQIVYDPKREQIRSAGYPGSIVQIWNYVHPDGLVRVDRLHYKQAYPVFELSEGGYERLKIHARRFYQQHPETNPNVVKDCVLQFFTSPRREGILKHPLLENFYNEYPVHIGIRLVTPDRRVYSFGYLLPPRELEKIAVNFFSNFLMTADAGIGMLDYEEFRPHQGRYVTSIPLSSTQGVHILQRIDALNAKQLRFNYARQNCSSLMNEVMPPEYHVNLRTTAKKELWGCVPSFNQIPYIGPLIGKVEEFVQRIWSLIADYTPQCLEPLFFWVDRIVFAVPRKCQTIAANLFLWIIGGAKMTGPLLPPENEEAPNEQGTIQSFSAIFRSWTDIFKDESSVTFHSRYFLDWQRQQASTILYPPSNEPRFVGLADFQDMPLGEEV